jgi:hypothetical protein
MVARMDRDAIARGRRRQAEEALEVERDRIAMLEAEVEDLITQLNGARIDEAAFAAMQPEDVETVRSIFEPASDFEVDEEWAADEGDEAPEEPAFEEDEEDPTAEIEGEISRLEAEIADSRQRRQALERYLDALGA